MEVYSIEKTIRNLAQKFWMPGWIKDVFVARRFVDRAMIFINALNDLGKILGIEVGLVILHVVDYTRTPTGESYLTIHPEVIYGTESGIEADYQRILEKYGQGIYEFEVERLIAKMNEGELDRLYHPAGIIHTHPLPPWFDALLPRIKDKVLRMRHMPSPTDIKVLMEWSLQLGATELYDPNQVLITISPATNRKSFMLILEDLPRDPYRFLDDYEEISERYAEKILESGEINRREELVMEWTGKIIELFISHGGVIEQI